MEHDITKLHPIHQKAYKEWLGQPILGGAPVPDEMYNVWLTLASIPQKNWGKQSTRDAVSTANDEQVEK